MDIKKILVPIDGTDRSMHSLDFIKELYDPSKVEISIINIKELVFIDGISISDEIKNSEEHSRKLLKKAKDIMEGYDVKLFFTFGYAGEQIVKKSKDDDIDIIVMTKSTKKGFTRIIGSVTNYVLKHADCTIMVIPE